MARPTPSTRPWSSCEVRALGLPRRLAVAIALAEGVLGLYLAYWIDVSPGPAIAALGAAVYALVALATAVRR